MKLVKTIFALTFVVGAVCFFAGQAAAIPTAEFSYLETYLGGGLWKYDYTLFNTSNPVASPGSDLYDVLLTFNPTKTFTLLSLPSGWGAIDGPGFVDAFSQNPGAPPVGTDIAPGTSLSGFTFQFDYQAGNLPFDATLTNPNDPNNPDVVSGTTSAVSAVPEPSTLLLFGTGLAVFAGFRRRFGKS